MNKRSKFEQFWDRYWHVVVLVVFFGVAVTKTFCAYAAEPETWLDVNVTSHHFSDKKFNQNNFGLGFEHSWGDALVMAGKYDNSLGTQSRYLLAGATPLHVGGVDIGIVAGGLDGYRNMQGGHPFLAAAGLIRFTGKDYGANLLILPPAKGSPWAIGLQFKRRF